jgi:hypothetical protein
MMTKKHFIRTAEIVKRWKFDVENNPIKLKETEITERLINALCDYYKKDNPRFNETRFKEACL